MPKLTPEEREARRKKVQEEALESVAARGQFNFRLDGKDIKRLYDMAGNRQKPVSAMVREWVLDRLDSEEHNKSTAPQWARDLEQRMTHTEFYLLAIAILSSTAESKDRLRSLLQEHVQKHGDIENDEELRALLAWTARESAHILLDRL